MYFISQYMSYVWQPSYFWNVAHIYLDCCAICSISVHVLSCFCFSDKLSTRFIIALLSSYMITLSGFIADTFFSQSFSSSLPITAGLGNRQAVSPEQANLHKSFHSSYPLQAPLYNICLHLGVHKPSHLLFLCSPPSSSSLYALWT